MTKHHIIAAALLMLPFAVIAQTGCSTTLTCQEVCDSMNGGCDAEDVADCVEECNEDQANAESCGDDDAWQEMLDCCMSADGGSCEGDFDACQKSDACGNLRPAGATDGC